MSNDVLEQWAQLLAYTEIQGNKLAAMDSLLNSCHSLLL
jgi:hypothetical protein